jgi:hypothetical protein|tara:strand:- start:293 stop:589 length:297 start_codon:yes stop_codon:yes gene_type:complete
MSAGESFLWDSLDKRPSFLIHDDFDDEYTANTHRFVTDLMCHESGPLRLYETGNYTYLRCGSAFPDIYTAKIKTDVFEAAMEEAASIPEDAPILLPRF